MSEKLELQKGLLSDSLKDVLDKAHVPMRHHLSILKVMEMNQAKHKKDRETHQKMMLEHARQLKEFETKNATHTQEYQDLKDSHAKQIADFEGELARHKTLIQGEPGYTPQKGVDYFDAEAPSVDEIVAAVLPYIPAPVKGDKGVDAVFDKDSFKKEMVEYIRKEKPFDISHIKGAQEFIFQTGQKNVKVKFEELMHGGGSSSSGGFSVITVSGAINDSNKIFTTSTAPTLVNVNGTFYRNGHGVTISGTNITLDNPVGTGGDIYAV